MAWSASKVFDQLFLDALENTAAFDLGGTPDTFKCSLWDNDITPDRTVSAANSAFGAGQWVSAGNEVFEAGQWATGGVALTTPDLSIPAGGTIMFDAADTSSGSAADLANVYGIMIYDDTLAAPVADQGVCFNYLGGANSVVNGTLSVVYAAPNSGIFAITT